MGVTLITGGARSGKSLHAEKLAKSTPGRPFYLFTADIRDSEMAARVALHQDRRGDDWQEIHAPRDLVGGLRACVGDGARLVDCLTLWLSNLMENDSDIAAHTAQLCDYLQHQSHEVIFVTSEVGLGIVPENALARRYRDALGLLNQQIGGIATRVDLVVAGQALRIK